MTEEEFIEYRDGVLKGIALSCDIPAEMLIEPNSPTSLRAIALIGQNPSLSLKDAYHKSLDYAAIEAEFCVTPDEQQQ